MILRRFLNGLRQWLFRHAPDEQRPIVLTQRRIFIVPSPAGLLYGLLLFVMLLGAINYNLGLGHALVFLLTGLGLVAMVHAFRNLVGLQLTPGRALPVFVGDIAHFPIRLENTRRQARRALDFAFQQQTTVALDVPAEARATVLIPCQAARRGRLDPGRITLSTRYPLGLFHAWSYPQPVWSCIVYPHPLLTPLPMPSPALDGAYRPGDSGQDDFAGLRPRQPADPTRHIAWKAVARDVNSRLLVKQFAGGAAEELWLTWELTLGTLETSATPAEPGTETRLSILAGWVLAAEEMQARYGLRLPGRTIEPAQGSAHRDACLEALALYEL